MKEADLLRADRELGRFIRYQYAEFRRIGYPRMSAFAKEMSRGTIAPVTTEDPLMDVVGEFYSTLDSSQKEILSWRYLKTETGRKMAEKMGVTRMTLYNRFDAIKRDCAKYLVKYA